MNEQYFVMRHQRGGGWVMECSPTTHRSARAVRDVLRSKWGRGRAMLCKVID